MTRFLLLPAAAAVLAASPAAALPPHPARTLVEADGVLADLSAIPLQGIPPALLADAHGVAIIPRVIKAGFVVGGQAGHGVVVTRGADGAWTGPTFVALGGASIGFQAGVQSADVVLVFKSRKSLDRILDGKGKLTLGADASVAAGPVGRQAMAATDARLQAEIVSYSRSRGLFAGVALDGTALVNDRDANATYARTARPEDAKAVKDLLTRIVALGTEPPAAAPLPPGAALPPPVLGPQERVMPVPPPSVPANPPGSALPPPAVPQPLPTR